MRVRFTKLWVYGLIIPLLSIAACEVSFDSGSDSTRIDELEGTIAAMSASPTIAAPLAPAEPTSPSATPIPQVPRLNLILLGCDTGLDIVHGMGEVTNAYLTIQNVGTGEATNVCARLSASDVGQAHPDETKCSQYLLPSQEVTQKLTIDTEFQVGTSIEIVVTSGEGLRETTGRTSCREIEPGLLDTVESMLGIPTDF